MQQSPAHAWQSAEESSLDAWFEGDSFYRSPERSVSYYTHGEVLGVLLDLRIRELTGDKKSLRDLFQYMNQKYAKQHRYFPDSQGVQEAAETITGQSFVEFFRDYVAGVKEIPYDDYFRYVGLQLSSASTTVGDAGFRTTSNIGGQPEVISVDPDGPAAHAGLVAGDRVVEMNGKPVSFRIDNLIARMRPGDTIKLRVAGSQGERKLKFKVGSRQQQAFQLADLPDVSAEQRAHRAAWIHGDDEAGGAQ